jgi:hypothetical protein
LTTDWHYLDKRIEALSDEIEALAQQESACDRLMPGTVIRGERTSVGVARMRGNSVRRWRSPCRTAIPRSNKNARIWLVTPVRWLTNLSRTRCSACKSTAVPPSAALASEATIGVGRGAGGSRVRRVRTESAGARSHGLRPPPSSARERRTDMSITGSVPRPAVLLYDQQFFSRNFC